MIVAVERGGIVAVDQEDLCVRWRAGTESNVNTKCKSRIAAPYTTSTE